MSFEDSRRRVFLRSQFIHNYMDASIQQINSSTDHFFEANSVLFTPHTRAASLRDESLRKSISVHPAQSTHRKEVAAAELDAAFRYMNIPRLLILAERTPKPFLFAVHSTDPGDLCASFSAFYLEWREAATNAPAGSSPPLSPPRPDLTVHSPQGVAMLEDIEGLDTPAATALGLVLAETTRALKNSRGRTEVVIRFETAGECHKFATSLITIKNYFETRKQ